LVQPMDLGHFLFSSEKRDWLLLDSDNFFFFRSLDHFMDFSYFLKSFFGRLIYRILTFFEIYWHFWSLVFKFIDMLKFFKFIDFLKFLNFIELFEVFYYEICFFRPQIWYSIFRISCFYFFFTRRSSYYFKALDF